jgi:isovaleryl-CoA dehydrogenase
MTDERSLEALRSSVREFAEREIAPIAAEIDRRDSFPRWLWPRLGELGVLGPTVPQADGGAGRSLLEHVVIVEEISRASGAVGMSYAAHSNLCVHNLCLHATQDQRRKWLPKLLSGEHVGALAMSESGAGSDVIGSMACRAERTDDGWLANGTKMWITNGPEADVLIVYMRTGPLEDRSASVTAFVVERGMAGFRASPKLDKLGMRGSSTSELVFTDCRISDDHVLGPVGGGARVLMGGLDSERLVLAGGPIGIMQAAFDLMVPYLRERRQFGRPIGSFELMQGKLADIHVALESSRAFAYRVARAFEREDGRKTADAAACLLYASESAVRVTLEAIQTYGGAGYLNESPAGRLLRDAKLYTIGAGTNEIRRMLIGRQLTGKLE